MNKLVGLLTLCLGGSIALGQAEAPPARGDAKAKPQARAVEDVLNERVPEVAFVDAPFEQVVEWLEDYTRVNVWVRWQELQAAGVERDKPISVRARNLRLSQVLWMILAESGGAEVKLGYGASDGLLIISTREDLSRELVVKVYDVRDLLERAPRFENPVRMDAAQALQSVSSGSTGGTAIFTQPDEGEERATTSDEDTARLIQLIMTAIEPDSWGPNRGTITAWRGKLVVRNSLHVHQQLGGALKDIEKR